MAILIVYVAVAVLLAVGLYHRLQAARTREPIDRRKEGWPLLIAIRLAGVALIAAVVTAAPPPPGPLQWVGVVLFIAAAAWLIWMFVSLGRNLTNTVVTRRNATFVTHGPYKYVRHPMYSGLLVGGLSLALVLGSWLLALVTITTFTLLAIRTRTEERYLIERFGDVYRVYIKKVGRFLPYIVWYSSAFPSITRNFGNEEDY